MKGNILFYENISSSHLPTTTAQMLILVANEINIPTLSTDIPIQFKKLLQPNKLDGAILLGDVNDKATLDYMRTLCDKVIIGASGSAIMLDKFKVGLVCDTDTQSYAISARKLNVDILLISGPKRCACAITFSSKLFLTLQPKL